MQFMKVVISKEIEDDCIFMFNSDVIRRLYRVPIALKFVHEGITEKSTIYTFFGWKKDENIYNVP